MKSFLHNLLLVGSVRYVFINIFLIDKTASLREQIKLSRI